MHTALVAVASALLACCAASPTAQPAAAPASDAAEPSMLATHAPVSPAPRPSSTPTPAPQPSLPATSPTARTRLDWARGPLPRGLQLCEDGCEHPWGVWPVFGGLAFGFGTGNHFADAVRLRWTANGTRWEALTVPPGFYKDWEGELYSDGSAAGAFAWIERKHKGRLWRTVDRGRTWRPVTGIEDWPALTSVELGAGRFLALADDPARLFTSADGDAWAEVVPIPRGILNGASADEIAVALDSDAAGFIATATDYMADQPQSWFTMSADGRTWTEPQALAEACAVGELVRVPSGFACTDDASHDADTPMAGVWVSPDGADWRFLGHDADSIDPLPDGGFLASTWQRNRLAFSYSPDGATWSNPVTAPCRDAWWSAPVGNTLFVWGPSGVWSARLPEASGSAVDERTP